MRSCENKWIGINYFFFAFHMMLPCFWFCRHKVRFVQRCESICFLHKIILYCLLSTLLDDNTMFKQYIWGIASLRIIRSLKLCNLNLPYLVTFVNKLEVCFSPKCLGLPVLRKYFVTNCLFGFWGRPQFS